MLQSDPETLDRIYEAAVFPELWPSVFDRIGRFVGADGGILFAANGADGRLGTSPRVMAARASDRFVPLMQAHQEDDWGGRSLCFSRLIQKRPAGFVGDLDLVTPEEMESHPYYNELLRPFGLAWAAGMFVALPSSEMVCFVVGRGAEAGPLDRSAIRLLDSLRPHLVQAALVSVRLRLQQARSTVDMLDDLGLPAAVIGGSGRLVAANPAFGKLRSPFVTRANGVISIACASANRLFQDAIAAERLGYDGARSIPIPATEEDPGLIVHLLPLRRSANDVYADSTYLMVVTIVVPRPAASADLLQGLFALTAAETLLAQALQRGETLLSYARRRDLSEATLRTQLKAIFAKTGTDRQASLVGLLTRLQPFDGASSDQMREVAHVRA